MWVLHRASEGSHKVQDHFFLFSSSVLFHLLGLQIYVYYSCCMDMGYIYKNMSCDLKISVCVWVRVLYIYKISLLKVRKKC